MELRERNTRQYERYKSGIGTNIVLTPTGQSLEIPGQLLDLNKVGGMGLFVPLKGHFENLSLSTIFGTWMVTRPIKGSQLSIESKLFNFTPLSLFGEQGLRISALAYKNYHAMMEDSAESRRHAKRLFITPRPVHLIRRHDRITGELCNVSRKDGVGIVLSRDVVEGIKWGNILTMGWRIQVAKKFLPCQVRRIALYGEQLFLGALAPGILNILASTPAEEPATRSRQEMNEDQELIGFLEDFMSGLHTPPKVD